MNIHVKDPTHLGDGYLLQCAFVRSVGVTIQFGAFRHSRIWNDKAKTYSGLRRSEAMSMFSAHHLFLDVDMDREENTELMMSIDLSRLTNDKRDM